MDVSSHSHVRLMASVLEGQVLLGTSLDSLHFMHEPALTESCTHQARPKRFVSFVFFAVMRLHGLFFAPMIDFCRRIGIPASSGLSLSLAVRFSTVYAASLRS